MRVLGLILLACIAIYAIQLAILLLILAGLIFRTKETIGLLLVFGVLAVVSKYPVPCAVIAAIGVLISLLVKRSDRAVATKPAELTDD